MKKAFICVLMILCLIMGLCACKEEEVPSTPTDDIVPTPTLAQPTNVSISAEGLITWDAVEHATSYVININDVEHTSSTNSFTAPDITKSFNFTVVAKAEGYNDSVPSEQETFVAKAEPKPPVMNLSVAINGASEIKSGNTANYSAVVTGSEDQEVVWSIVKGKEFATIEKSTGVVTANEVSGDCTIVIKAKSKADNKSYAEKAIGIVAKPVLTAEMLDSLKNVNKMCFEGFMNIDVYSKGLTSRLEQSYVSVIRTAMDDQGHWYAEYEDAGTGISQGIYYSNHDGIACNIGLNLMNQEQYYPLTDDDGSDLSWVKSGLYNNFPTLGVDDFIFDEESWRFVYKHKNSEQVKRMIASANPYDFVTETFALIISDGEIMGITAKSVPDETLVQGYTCYESLFVAVNTKDTVEVPTIPTYVFDEEVHTPLKTALENMQGLTSYSVDYFEMSYYLVTSSYVTKGYFESITPDDCFFVPYTVSRAPDGEEVKNKDESGAYGYHKFGDDLYNSYFIGADLKSFKASRAFTGSIDKAKPSFAFAPEIFRSFNSDEETGATTYYVEKLMANVATTYYYGVGNDSNLYGIYATEGYVQNQPFLPYVTVSEIDGTLYITEAGFYFYLGSFYGFITIKYSDFNSANLDDLLPEGVTAIDFEIRTVPTSWDDMTIVVSDDSSTMNEDLEVPASAYISEFFKANKTVVETFDVSDSGLIAWDVVPNTAFYLVTYTVSEEDEVTGKIVQTGRAEVVTANEFDAKTDRDNLSNVKVVALDEDKSDELPFFGSVLGDTYGFALTGMRLRSGENLMKPVLQIYYDVPLDLNYSIDSSLKAVKDYLVGLGFVKNAKDEYVKDDLVILPLDVSLDFIIYVWYDPAV